MSQITIGANDARIATHVSAASTGPFAVDFPFAQLDDVAVTVQADGSGSLMLLVRGVDYTIAGTPDEAGMYPDGVVTLIAAVSNATVVRYRATEIERLSNFPLEGYFSRLALNAELNRMTLSLQEFYQNIAGSLRLGPADGGPPLDPIPPMPGRANMLLGFNGVGQPALYPPTALSPVVPSETVADTAYTLKASDNGKTKRFIAGLPTLVAFPPDAIVDFQCLLFAAGDGLVSVVEAGLATIDCGFDAAEALHRTIDGKGFGLHVWCDANVDGAHAHYWIQGVTRT